jgi:hypothetical protein
MSLTSRLVVSTVATLTSALDLATGTVPLALQQSIELASGTGANQADRIWHDERTLTASSSENLDLAGSLADAFGTTITFARIKAIVVGAASANTNNVQVGGAASNAFVNWVANSSDIVNVPPGAVLALIAPGATAFPVTAGTGDILKIANSGAGTGVTYDIVLIGASA